MGRGRRAARRAPWPAPPSCSTPACRRRSRSRSIPCRRRLRGRRADPHAALDRQGARASTKSATRRYYDLTDQVPERVPRAERHACAYKNDRDPPGPAQPSSDRQPVRRRQAAPITDPGRGATFKCRGGALDGQDLRSDRPRTPAAPTAAAPTIRPDQHRLLRGEQPAGRRHHRHRQQRLHRHAETATTITYADGVYNEIPLKGVIIWNSHAFNLTDQDGKLEAWINSYFAKPEEQQYPVDADLRRRPSDPLQDERPAVQGRRGLQRASRCRADAQLFELSSHMHQRGKRWRTLDGRLACQGGPHDGEACSPFGPDDAFETTDLCAGAPCQSKRCRPRPAIATAT